MSDPKPDVDELGDELQSYFAVTTATPLPPRVARMSARTLPARRPSMAKWFAGATGALATAALVILVGLHALPHGGGAALSSNAASSQRGAASGAAPQSLAFSYQGVDTAVLAAHGVRLLPPTGHGNALVAPVQAQQAASAAAGSSVGSPGPAELAYAELSAPATPRTCLCWVVDVPVSAGAQEAGGASGYTRLVLVDALSGRVVAVLAGNGIP